MLTKSTSRGSRGRWGRRADRGGAVVSLAVAASITGATLSSGGERAATGPGTALARVHGVAPTTVATAILEVEYPTSFDAEGDPTDVVDTPVSSAAVDSDGSFSLPVPISPEVLDAVQNGWLTTVADVDNGTMSTTTYTPIMMAKTAGDAGSDEDVIAAGSTVEAAPLPPMEQMSPAAAAAVQAQQASRDAARKQTRADPNAIVVPMDNTVCHWTRIARSEPAVGMGELHVADATGSTGTFMYRTQADPTFDVGLSTSGTSWGVHGTVHVSNSIGTTASYSTGRDSKTYANDHMYFSKDMNNGAASCPGRQYKTHPTSSVGDVFIGPSTPDAAPWGTCHDDPHGWGLIEAHTGTFDDDRAHAHTYDFVGNAFGFNVGGRTGCTNGIHIALKNTGPDRTWTCGDRAMPNPSIVYNQKW